MSRCVFIANNCFVGEAVHDCSHIMRVARVDVPRNDGRQIHLFVRDGRAGWTGKMDDFEAIEADFTAPFFKIGGRIIERVAAVLGFVLGFPGAQRFRQIIPVLEQPRIEHLRDSTNVARAAAVEIQSGGRRVEIFRVGALTFEKFHCHERIEKICDAAMMQVKFLGDLRACEPALTECAEEIERDRSQQDLGIPEAERGLQNYVRCWRGCFHTVVDVANLPGATSDECREKKIDSLRFIESRIRGGECEPARKKCAECEANHPDGAINSRQLLSIDFLRSTFSE